MDTPVDAPDRTARRAVTLAFLANGIAVASFLVRIPDVRDQLSLREATIGLLLSGLAVGVVFGLLLAGRIVGRVGSRALTLGGGASIIVLLPLAGFAPNRIALVIVLALLGAGSSMMDVGMNAQGVGVERGFGRSIMLGLHGAWSVGTLLGALGGSIAMGLGLGVGPHLVLVTLFILLCMVVATPGLRVADRLDPGTRPRLALPRGPLFPLALVAFAAAVGESTATDWSGIHLADNLEVAAGRVGWGFVAYTAAMTVVRLLGDAVVRRAGPGRTVVAGGISGGIGFIVVAVAPALPVALIGFVLIGLGMGVTVPLAFAAAGKVSDAPGAGVAAVATIGYLAFIIGPVLVGVTAEAVGLPAAFVGVAVLITVLTTRRQPALSG